MLFTATMGLYNDGFGHCGSPITQPTIDTLNATQCVYTTNFTGCFGNIDIGTLRNYAECPPTHVMSGLHPVDGLHTGHHITFVSAEKGIPPLMRVSGPSITKGNNPADNVEWDVDRIAIGTKPNRQILEDGKVRQNRIGPTLVSFPNTTRSLSDVHIASPVFAIDTAQRTVPTNNSI